MKVFITNFVWIHHSVMSFFHSILCFCHTISLNVLSVIILTDKTHLIELVYNISFQEYCTFQSWWWQVFKWFLSRAVKGLKLHPTCVCMCMRSHRWFFAIPWNPWSHQASLSMEFSWQEYWSGLPCPTPGDLPYPGIEPSSPALAGFFTTLPTRKPFTPLSS